jgi:hypothetical protein
MTPSPPPPTDEEAGLTMEPLRVLTPSVRTVSELTLALQGVVTGAFSGPCMGKPAVLISNRTGSKNERTA